MHARKQNVPTGSSCAVQQAAKKKKKKERSSTPAATVHAVCNTVEHSPSGRPIKTAVCYHPKNAQQHFEGKIQISPPSGE